MSNTPFTRREQYYDAIANGSTDVPDPIAGDEDLASLIIYQSTSGVKCFTTTAF